MPKASLNRSHAPDSLCFAVRLLVEPSLHSEGMSSGGGEETVGESRFLGSEAFEEPAVGGSPVVRRGESVADLSVNRGGITVERRNMVLGMGFGDGCLGLSRGIGTELLTMGLENDEDGGAGLKAVPSSTASSSLSLAHKQGPE